MNIPKVPNVGVASKAFTILRVGFFVVFFVLLTINAIITGIQQHDLTQTVKILGKQFYDPLNSASETAMKISTEESVNFFDSLSKYFSLYYNIYILYLWFVVLRIPINFVFKETSPPIMRFFLTIFLFYFVMVLFSVLVLKDSVNMPFVKTWQIIQGLISIFSNPNFSTSFSNGNIINNSCTDSVCQA